MRRDLELVRRILLDVEGREEGKLSGSHLVISGYSDNTVAWHVEMLIEAGYVEGTTYPAGNDEMVAQVERLTWSGYDFLAAAKNDTVWRKGMSIVAQRGGSVTLDIMKSLLLRLLSTQFGLPG